MKRFIPSVVTIAGLAVASAPAANAEPTGSSATNTWSGFYVGGHAGYAFATSNWTSDIATPRSGTTSLPGSDKQFGPLTAGVQLGYNYILPGGLLFGVEADLSFPDEMQSKLQLAAPIGPLSDAVQIYGSARGSAGYAFGNWLVYGTGGFAYDRDRITDGAGNEVFFWRTGWTAGLGTEVRLTKNWSAKLEYSYFDFARTGIYLPAAGQRYNSGLALQTIQLGLNYRFGTLPGDPVLGGGIVSDLDKWSLHEQSTVIGMANLPFHSSYSGPNSLYSGFQARDTWSVTGFFGYNPWNGTEFYFDPEPFQGYGLSVTHGLAGFPNGEALKAGYDYPHYNTARAFVRQTFGFGGEQEELEDGQNQVASKVDVSRLTFTAGKFAIPDIFDANTYSHDPRASFMNWSLMDAGAFDYAADQKGYSWGTVAELNQKTWAVRTGYFLEPDIPGGNNIDTRLGQRGQYLLELEERFNIFSQPGKLRLTGWEAQCYCGSFSDTLANFPQDIGNGNLTNDITLTRQTRSEYGFIANLEQAVTNDLGVFTRLSWNSGQTEIMAWTDINESASFGGVLKGTSWGRPDDKVGVAGIVNGISSEYQAYLAAGGLGINIGDGALTNYQLEEIMETYYSLSFTKWAALTFDYQFVANPGYNADRGPVHIGSMRLHFEF
jgi:high affinity Mn2+ porin